MLLVFSTFLCVLRFSAPCVEIIDFQNDKVLCEVPTELQAVRSRDILYLMGIQTQRLQRRATRRERGGRVVLVLLWRG